MIKKIICPIDFSASSLNAAEYAARLAVAFNARLIFINVQQILMPAAAVSMGEGIGGEVRKNTKLVSQKLNNLASETIKDFNISVDYEVDITLNSLEKIVAELDDEAGMIVMGTNGIDDVGQYIWGTNTYNVIKKARCPVLVVPENVSYSGIRKIVFAWDYNENSKFSFSKLRDFMKSFNPKFVFLHVSKRETVLGKDVFKALRSEIISVLGDDSDADFEQIFADDVPESINRYMNKSQADILSITFYNRGLIPDLFHGKVAKELTATAQYPILVLHG